MARVKLGDDDEDTLDVTPDSGPAEAPAEKLIEVALCQPNPENPRSPAHKIAEMEESLRTGGQLQNINVMSVDAFLREKPYLADQLDHRPHVVVNGCRRLAAAPGAGMSVLKYELRDEWTAEDIDRAVVSENEDRVDVNPLHLGRFLRRMEVTYGSGRKVAAAIGKSQGWVQQRIALTKLHPDLQQLIDGGGLTFELARACPRLAPELQPRLASGELPADVVMAWVVRLKLKHDEQLARWTAGPPFDVDEAREPAPPANTPQEPEPPAGETEDGTNDEPPADKPRPIVIRLAERNPVALAGALRREFSDEEIGELVTALTTGG